MNKGRLEAFSDGMFAIIFTIMVLELSVPHGTGPEALRPLASTILTRALLTVHGNDSVLATALGSDVKGKVSLAIYVVAIPLAFIHPLMAFSVYALVAIMWLIPDRRIERRFT
jgi:uncharacterized membrane protein